MKDKEINFTESSATEVMVAQSAINLDVTLKQRRSDWWRWPLVPVASIAGASLAVAIVFVFHWIMVISEANWVELLLYPFVTPIVASGIFGFFWSSIAYLIAPRGKLIAAVVMTIILGFLLALASIRALNDSGDILDKVKFIVTAIIAMITSICGLVIMNKEK
jgi:hypothetical protein